MANPATLSDLESRWRPLHEHERNVGQAFLDDAWRMLRRRMASLDVDLEDEAQTDYADLLAETIRVIATAVLRAMKNQDTQKELDVTDPSWLRDESLWNGVLYFTADEIAALAPAGDGSTGAFSFSLIGTGYPDDRFPDDAADGF